MLRFGRWRHWHHASLYLTLWRPEKLGWILVDLGKHRSIKVIGWPRVDASLSSLRRAAENDMLPR